MNRPELIRIRAYTRKRSLIKMLGLFIGDGPPMHYWTETNGIHGRMEDENASIQSQARRHNEGER